MLERLLPNSAMVAMLLVLAGLSAAVAEIEVVDPFEVVAALDRAVEMKLWPGFDAGAYPAAIYDGSRTLLFRHPAPPSEFEPLNGRPGVSVFAGKHPAMRWNSNAEIGGLATATLLLTLEPGRPVEYEAHILFHEIFHLYSRPLHPTWRPDEMSRYSYPVGDVDNYRQLLLEEEALARAVEAEADETSAAWATTALRIRNDRMSRLRAEHRAYEIALELQEGTAVYVGRSTLRAADDTSRLREPRGPGGIRWRCYETGAAIAVILDRLMPSWKSTLDAEPEATFAELLGTPVARTRVSPAAFTDDEVAGIAARSGSEVAELSEQRAALQEAFDQRGPQIIVRLADERDRLRLEQFDPMAVELLVNGRALHTHRLLARHPRGEVRLENPHFVRGSFDGVIAMSEPAGEHPFLAGLRRIVVAGSSGEPVVAWDGDRVRIEAEGLAVEFDHATLETNDHALIVTVLPDTTGSTSGPRVLSR
ncbi:MAG TPA: hypothetical protein QGG47_10525 [Acidobacteriota bacterium]|nr:hypothetical protein [Acidobacteriota bacterium]